VYLGVGVFWTGFFVHTACGLSDEREPLLPVPTRVRRHEVLVFAQQNLVRDLMVVIVEKKREKV
jgi:hypothetical protein